MFRPAGRVSLLYRRFSSRPDCRNRPIDRLEWDDPRVANEYAWASSDQERQRLASQGDLLRPATERLFSAAGIGPGARVLDCGSGGGDVSVIVAEMVSRVARFSASTATPLKWRLQRAASTTSA